MSAFLQKRILATCCCLLLLASAAAYADDSEIFAGCTAPDQAATSFAAPVTVTNAFNRTQTLDDVYVALANGDIKKYQLNGTAVVPDSMFDHARGAELKESVHSQPAVVIYGGKPKTPDIDDAVLYAVSNDGLLHAIDPRMGVELWSYAPPDTSSKRYALDGSIRVLEYDTNGDGVVDPSDNDRVILFFGQGHGGSHYYAVDVTDKKPQLIWTIGPSTAGLAAIGQTWSTPAIARVRIAGATQNSQQFVLIFGGGYDTADDSVAYQSATARGNAIYMVDAIKGTVLWSASSSSADLMLKRMDHAIPSDVAVLDLDGDGYADRMYVGDLAAQLWRFDIFNGKPADELVAGGVIASLGARDDPSHATASARRFYNAPDVAAIRRKGAPPFFNLAIGSGYRAHPLDTEVQDRFYSVRDYRPFDRLSQAQYDDPKRSILQDKDLVDVTANVGASTTPGVSKRVGTTDAGWKVLLDLPRNAWTGEKVLASAATLNGQILFPTYTPNSGGCSASAGLNRMYALDVFDGSGQYTGLSQTGIASHVAFLFPASGAGNPPTVPHYPRLVCLSGTEVLGACRNGNVLEKTYWSESNAR